ncbi:MAG: SGNH/GDSL hydrolase family protein [Agriterribacter sp.]
MKKIFLFIIAGCFLFSFTKKEITWVAIGDSITYLNDHADETGKRITKGYLTMVQEKMPGIKAINKGFNGWTSGGIAEKFATLDIKKADIYSIFLGTNDWWQGRTIGTLDDYKNNSGNNTVYGSFRIIINELRKLNPKAKIILITPLQRADFVYINDAHNNAYGSYKPKNDQTLAQFAAAINTIGKFEKFSVVDLYNKSGITQQNIIKYKRLRDPSTGIYKNYGYPDFINIPFNPATDEYPYPVESIDMTYDGLHPSDKGYEVITKMLLKVMK